MLFVSRWAASYQNHTVDLLTWNIYSDQVFVPVNDYYVNTESRKFEREKKGYLTNGERMWGQAEARPNKVALSPLSASRSVSPHQVRLVVSRKWAQVGINTVTLPHLLCLLWLELPAHCRQSPALCWLMITDWLQHHLCYDNKNLIHVRLIWY